MEYSTGVADSVTFLDVVRELGAVTLESCFDECQAGMHRQEAARHLGALMGSPLLLRRVVWVAERAWSGE